MNIVNKQKVGKLFGHLECLAFQDNIMGNDYRLVAKINFEKQWLFIRFIGTHKDYDKIDANNI